MIYLDHAATTPLDPRVLAAMRPYLGTEFYNPSATYLPARQVRDNLLQARSRVAYWLGVRPGEIIFTAGGTEANNLAVQGVLRAFAGTSSAVSSVEHESVLAPARLYDTVELPVDVHGRVQPQDVQRQIRDTTVLVSVMYANNEVGTIQPLRQIAAVLRGIRAARQAVGNRLPLYFHTDACQVANYLDVHVSRLGVDLLTLNGSKLYGPKQTGVLYVAAHVQLWPLILGGGQERGYRSGTENVAGAIGFAAALDMAQSMRGDEARRLSELQKQAFHLLAQKIPGVIINGSTRQRLPGNLHITVPGHDNERLLLQLEQQGILAAAGSACSASSDEPSHVLRAMGLSDAHARSSLRFTMGRSTTAADVEQLTSVLARLTTKQ